MGDIMGRELGQPDIEISGDAEYNYFIFISDYEDYGLDEIAAEFANKTLGLSKPLDNKTTFYKVGSNCTEDDIISEEEVDSDWSIQVNEQTFENSDCKMTVVDTEISVGASGGYEQILINMMSGAAATVVGYFVIESIKAYGNKKDKANEKERKDLIISFLKKRYGIKSNLLIVDTKMHDDEWYYKVEDVANDIVFELFLNDSNGVRVIRIKN